MGLLTIQLDDSLKEDLERLAQSLGCSIERLAGTTLHKYVVVDKFRRLRRQALPLAEAAGYSRDEDIFGSKL